MENLIYEYRHDKETHLFINEGLSNIAKPHFHRSTEILYLMEGEMNVEVGENKFVATPDDIIFVHNYYRHAFSPVVPYRKVFVVIPFNYGNDFEAVFKHSSLPPILTDKDFNKENLRPIYEKLFDERKTMPSLVKKGYLNVILGNLFDRYPSVPLEQDGSIELLVGILNYIDVNFDKELSLESLATTFGYNKYYFSRLFNSCVGENLNNYINIVRLQHFMDISKKEENIPIAELAFSCGFDSLTTFYRYFNKVYDKKPKAMLTRNSGRGE